MACIICEKVQYYANFWYFAILYGYAKITNQVAWTNTLCLNINTLAYTSRLRYTRVNVVKNIYANNFAYMHTYIHTRT